MLHAVCQHCDTEIAEGRRFCDRCGAPVMSAQVRTSECAVGYKLFSDVWKGYSFQYPEDWQIIVIDEGVLVESPDKTASLEFRLLPAGQMITATQQAELFLRRLGVVNHQRVPGGNDGYAQFVFEGPSFQGLLSSNISQRGGTLVMGKYPSDGSVELEPIFQNLLATLTTVKPIARQNWVDPNESSFAINHPLGWKPQASINPGSGMGLRLPRFSVSAAFGDEVFIALDIQTRIFINGELPKDPPEEEGFFSMLGRMAKKVEHGMATALGETICPFPGLGPAVENFFLPYWQQIMPGCEIIHIYEPAFNQMDVRLLLPTGAVRVYRLQGDAFKVPGMTNRWAGGHVYYYQAPAVMMAQFEPVLRGIAESYNPNPQWQQREHARMQQVARQQQFQANQWAQVSARNHQMRMNDIQRAGQSQQAIYNTYNDISDMQMAGWESRQASSDYLQHQTVNSIREMDDFVNPNSGTVFNLSSHQANYWENPNSDVILGSDLQLDLPPAWTPLHKSTGRPPE